MSARQRWLLIAVVACALGSTGPCDPAAAPPPPAAPAATAVDPEISAGAEGPAVAIGYRGSPLLLTAMLIHPDYPAAAAASTPILLAHATDWSRLVRFEIATPAGAPQPWPIAVALARAPSATLDAQKAAQLAASVAPSDTAQLATGNYLVRAVLDASAATRPGAYQGVVRSAWRRFELRDGISQPTLAEDEALALFHARYALLLGDFASARATLSTLLTSQPASIPALTLLSDLDYAQGALDQATIHIADALAAWDALPDPNFSPALSEPPTPLLERQNKILTTRLRLAGNGARPAISARISAKAPSPQPDTLELDVTFTNTGAATALDAKIEAVTGRTLQGVGNVSLDGTLGPALPIELGALAPGASTTVRLNVRVDPGVVRFALTESGATDANFGTFGFSLTQATYK
jgi:hypothetical protein